MTNIHTSTRYYINNKLNHFTHHITHHITNNPSYSAIILSITITGLIFIASVYFPGCVNN